MLQSVTPVQVSLSNPSALGVAVQSATLMNSGIGERIIRTDPTVYEAGENVQIEDGTISVITTDVVEAGNSSPVTSNAVAEAIDGIQLPEDVARIRRDTTENWNANPGFIPEAGEIVVYVDRFTGTDDQGNTTLYPGLKIGDGNAYLIDLPFVHEYEMENLSSLLNRHIGNESIHTSDDERIYWNQKVSCYLGDSETLVFYTN